MSKTERLLTDYAAYHRDRRNVWTHFVGVPMIVLAIHVLLSRPLFEIGGWLLAPAVFLSFGSALWYLAVELRFGLVMTAFLAFCVIVGLELAQLPTLAWLAWGVGLFVVGWLFQFLGHHYEGRKPAFLDDLKSLLVGPLFVLAEMTFMLGLRRDLQRKIDAAHG